MTGTDILTILGCLVLGYMAVSFLMGGAARRREPRSQAEAPALHDAASPRREAGAEPVLEAPPPSADPGPISGQRSDEAPR